MEQMPYHPDLDRPAGAADTMPLLGFTGRDACDSDDWRIGLPVLEGQGLTLRELEIGDAPALFAELTTEEVTRFISPPPANVEGFERFIRWTHAQRSAGKYACFAVVPEGQTTAVGMFQVRFLDADHRIAEWGFAMGSSYWGSGLFVAGAELVLEFAFTEMEVRRLEARSATPNLRGNGALRKIGAVREGVIPQSLELRGEKLDQVLWVILASEWLRKQRFQPPLA
jgi:RimJ/RimL family protein N-acetyltransferase